MCSSDLRTLAPTDYKEFGPRIGLAYSPSASEGLLGKILGGPGKSSIRAAYGIYYTATEDLTLFDIVADAPYGQFWVAPQSPLMQEPFRTRSDGSSQGVHFPFIFPIPGSPANKTLDYSIFLPIGGSPGPWYLNPIGKRGMLVEVDSVRRVFPEEGGNSVRRALPSREKPSRKRKCSAFSRG